jgi:hypothetical protein
MWRKAVRIGVGVVLLLLGLLWALQGADIIRIKPIGCVAECEPITGGSLGWLVAGVLAMLVGLLLLLVGRRRH